MEFDFQTYVKGNVMKVCQNILWMGGVCLLYLATAKIGLKYAVVGQTVTMMWPPSGIALAAVLIGGYRVWPGITLGAFIANAGTGISMSAIFIISLGNTLEPLCGAMLLKRSNNFSNELDKVSDVLSLVLFAAIISTAISASLGTLGLFVGGEIATDDLAPTWWAWWLGDGLGVLVISPFLLFGFGKIYVPPTIFSSIKILEAIIMIAGLIFVGQALFENPMLAGPGNFPVSLSLFPFAIWSALRFGSIGAAAVTLLVSIQAIHGTVQGTGPFAVGSYMESLFRWCLFADIMAMTGLLLGAVNSERTKALAALRSSNEDLEREVRKRTNELTRANIELQTALKERWSLQLEMNQINEERLKMIGQELHDSLGQQLTGISFWVSSLQEVLSAKSAPEVPLVDQVKYLLEEGLSMTRSLSRGLYPIALETGGFSSAIHHLAEYTQSFSGIRCTFQCASGVQLIDKTVALNLYRIVQEAVSNALHHSKAQCIEIKLTGVGEHYKLSVEDNGIGFEDQSIKTDGTFGLRSMRNRADLIGAAIEVCSNPICGTSVVVTGSMKREG